jgi:hypothetical protein
MAMNPAESQAYGVDGTALNTLRDKFVAYTTAKAAKDTAQTAFDTAEEALSAAVVALRTADAEFTAAFTVAFVIPDGYTPPV